MIATVTTLGDAAQTAGVVVAALLGAAVLLAGSPRARAAAMLGALVLTPVLLVANIWSTPQFEPLRERAGLALAAGRRRPRRARRSARSLIHRRPELLALAAAAALPFRVPIESGGDTANLLVPLYLVIAAGVLAYALPRLRAPRGLEDIERGDEREVRHERGPLEWLLAAAIVLYAVQATYSSDFDGALAQTIFFYVPFALLYALLVRIRWTAQLAGRCLIVLLVLAAAFVGDRLRRVRQARAAAQPEGHQPPTSSSPTSASTRCSSTRTSTAASSSTVMLGARRRAAVEPPPGARGAAARPALVLLWAGLVLTLSQSSFTALLVGLTVLGALRWGTRPGGGARRRLRARRRRRRARGAGRGRHRGLGRQRLQRALVARARRRRAGRRAAGDRLGLGVVQDASTARARTPRASARRRPRTRSRSRSPPSRASAASCSTSRSSASRS